MRLFLLVVFKSFPLPNNQYEAYDPDKGAEQADIHAGSHIRSMVSERKTVLPGADRNADKSGICSQDFSFDAIHRSSPAFLIRDRQEKETGIFCIYGSRELAVVCGVCKRDLGTVLRSNIVF